MTDIAETSGSSRHDPAVSVSMRATSLQRAGWVFVAAPTAVLAVVAFVVVGPLPAVAVAVVVAAMLVVMWRSFSARPAEALLKSVPTESVDPVRHARLVNLVEGLSLVTGTSRPELRVCAGAQPFAMVVAARDDAGIIVVSEGAMVSWGRMETEAVVAHLLFRLRSGDAALTTTVLAVAGGLSRVMLSSYGRWILSRVLDGSFVLSADLAACRTTRYPPAMVSALECLLETGVSSGDMPVPESLAPLCFAWPANDATGASGFPSVESFHPPVADRIALCKEI